MMALGPLLSRLAVFAAGCLVCVICFDLADARQAARSRPPAPPPKCGCDDKQAMQRDIDDFEMARQRTSAKSRRASAGGRRALPSMGRSIADGSDEMTALWNSYNAWEQGTGPNTARGEFETARKYVGSIVVTFNEKTNLPDPEQLATARRRAACLAIAESISFHEQRHTDVRNAGGGRYSRPSQLAREEAAHYEAGGKFVQDAPRCTPLPASAGVGSRYG